MELNDELELRRNVTLVDLADRLLDKGAVVAGDITLAVADIDLVYISLRALIASVETIQTDNRRGNPSRDTSGITDDHGLPLRNS